MRPTFLNHRKDQLIDPMYQPENDKTKQMAPVVKKIGQIVRSLFALYEVEEHKKILKPNSICLNKLHVIGIISF